MLTAALDHRAAALAGRLFHDLETIGHGLPRFCIAELVVQPRAADDIGEQD
jgi:hypothetical protein